LVSLLSYFEVVQNAGLDKRLKTAKVADADSQHITPSPYMSKVSKFILSNANM